MDAQATIDRIFAAIDMGQRMEDIMRADERARGFTVVVPGQVPWLSAEDWEPNIVVSINGDKVRLIAMLRKPTARGALRRTVEGIKAAGLIPTVLEPTHEMRDTLTRWGWKGKRHGYGIDSEEIWKPRNR